MKRERGGGATERVQCRARFSIFSYLLYTMNFPTFSLDARAIANRLSQLSESNSEISPAVCVLDSILFLVKMLGNIFDTLQQHFRKCSRKKEKLKDFYMWNNGNGLPRGNLKHFSTQCKIFNYPNCPQKIEMYRLCRLHSISRYTKNI